MTTDEWLSRRDFWQAAQAQRVCQVCGGAGNFDAHHVITRQELRRSHLDEWDTRNALRVCKLGQIGTDCHGRHHSAMSRILSTVLSDVNITYAFEVLGERAGDYFRRFYADADIDPRITVAA